MFVFKAQDVVLREKKFGQGAKRSNDFFPILPTILMQKGKINMMYDMIYGLIPVVVHDCTAQMSE